MDIGQAPGLMFHDLCALCTPLAICGVLKSGVHLNNMMHTSGIREVEVPFV